MIGSMKKYETCTPANIAELTETEILEKAVELSDTRVPVKVKLAILRRIYAMLGFNLSNDLLLALLVDVKHQLVLACAGGCKTTSSQIAIMMAKILWKKAYGRHLTASEILCLVYNKENRPQMEKKHAELLTPMIMSGFLSYNAEDAHYINAGITAHTLHSFCKHWVDQYLSELKMDGYTTLQDGDAPIFFSSAIRSVKKQYPDLNEDIRVERIQTLYDLLYELELTYNDISEKHPLLSDAVCSCNATVEQIRKIFIFYDQQKAFFRRYDFIDMLVLMNRLLNYEEVRNRMHLLYTFIVVDEIQDFTPLMMTILKKIVGPDARLLAIGDEDQSIYGFRGADVNNAVRFKEHFPESKIFQLLVNRRCGDNILDSASAVINLNINRYDKQLVAERAGGAVDLIGYTDLDQQLENLTGIILDYSKEEQQNTVICAREKAYGQPLTFSLFRYRVPFHTYNAHTFYYHEAFRGFTEIMNLIWKPSRDNWRNLYKITNIKKADWFEYIGYNEKKQKAENFPEKSSLWELRFEPFTRYAGLEAALNQLHSINKNINSSYCKDYIDYILRLFQQNFWETRISMEPILFSTEVFDWIRGVFAKSSPYPVLFGEFAENLKRLETDQRYQSGVCVATMHALKGLEYKNVHLTFMEESIFPGFDGIDSKNYLPEVAVSLKEAENRLAYVAMTRAKDHLYLHYNINDPSFYVTLLNTPTVGGLNSPMSPRVFSNKKKW